MRLSVTARIALLAIMLSLVSNLALIGFVWKQTSADAIDAIRRETTEQSDALRTVWQVGGIPELRQAIGEAVSPGDVSLVLALVDADGHAGAVLLAAGREGARVLLLGGEPFGEEVVMWWNFIGRSHDEVVAAREAWEAGLAVPLRR